MSQNNQNNAQHKATLQILVRESGVIENKLVELDLDSVGLNNADRIDGARIVYDNGYANVCPVYNGFTKTQLFEKIKTILDASIINKDQKEAIYALLTKEVCDMFNGQEDTVNRRLAWLDDYIAIQDADNAKVRVGTEAPIAGKQPDKPIKL